MASVFLIPNFLGESSVGMILPNQVIETVRLLNHFIVENEKSARKFIKRIAPEKSQQELVFFTINKHTEPSELPSFLEPCLSGFSMGIISEAGCPGIADPGAEIVKIAHRKQIKVVPLVGPSSILLAMMASGLNGQSFAFNGYLPIDKLNRKKMLKSLEKKAIESNQTQIFIETPYRNDKMFADLIEILNSTTMLCIACDINLETEEIKTQTIAQWKKEKVSFQKRPAIFIIGS